MIGISWAFLGAALALAVVVLVDRLRLSRHLLRLRDRNEKLGDEIWEIRAAVEARQRAEAASEAKSRFLATVSHEIRTPLNGILGIADLLGATPLDREQLAYVEAVRTSGRALATLIDEILDFSRIEAGRLTLESEAFDLAALVESVVELLAPRAQDKGLEIAAFLDPAVPLQVMGDPVRVRQVLTNLAGNAVKFTEAGGIGVSVTVTDAGAIRFAVADTGPGVPLERRDAIFEEFEQGDGTTTRSHGGTGLGLAISRSIVERMGGALTLADRPDGGSIFSFDVDLVAADEAAAQTVPWSDLNGCRALIAANSPFQAPFLAARLRAAGAEVTVLTQVADALDHLADYARIDFVFVDCALGELATETLAEAARVAGARRAFLLFSPFERRAFGQSLASGFDGWLVKPVRAGSLAARLGGPSEAPRQETSAVTSSNPARRCALRVLLAEDNEINTLVAMNFLGRIGVQVVHAADGNSALALALSAMRGEIPGFDSILMDVSMPGLDGLEVARRLRRAESVSRFAPVRIVALTAHAFAEDRLACLTAGIDEVVTKPVDFPKLAAALTGHSELRSAS